jgi:hypothetical protein
MNDPVGHKASQRLIEGEAYRRIMSGRVPEMLSDFARELSDWFRQTHPTDTPLASNVVEDHIRDTWHRRHELVRGGD